jgi:hypothetical protein
LDAGEEGLGGLVVGVLGDELAAEGFGENGLVEVIYFRNGGSMGSQYRDSGFVH